VPVPVADPPVVPVPPLLYVPEVEPSVEPVVLPLGVLLFGRFALGAVPLDVLPDVVLSLPLEGVVVEPAPVPFFAFSRATHASISPAGAFAQARIASLSRLAGTLSRVVGATAPGLMLLPVGD